jgi:hypothetical protein
MIPRKGTKLRNSSIDPMLAKFLLDSKLIIISSIKPIIVFADKSFFATKLAVDYSIKETVNTRF